MWKGCSMVNLKTLEIFSCMKQCWQFLQESFITERNSDVRNICPCHVITCDSLFGIIWTKPVFFSLHIQRSDISQSLIFHLEIKHHKNGWLINHFDPYLLKIYIHIMWQINRLACCQSEYIPIKFNFQKYQLINKKSYVNILQLLDFKRPFQELNFIIR